ncbi:hypothetical protein SACE_6146 [Saccharopolyspora erythraea NRRL 2338]|uniref:Uncharacterized protein n=1 Tax=Saccharopolyspora erythraea (strain ATCC 11635 / DSM 40517 / JCM 4748 / NBRC 13426 / NCIMB 8594 / NRRL 2338) TaxID=405948 RepID=A4FMP4_SACEN|nr:hypothetical protein SACE_6146 [Saccharopolyspora erythraea NRRL 2338]
MRGRRPRPLDDGTALRVKDYNTHSRPSHTPLPQPITAGRSPTHPKHHPEPAEAVPQTSGVTPPTPTGTAHPFRPYGYGLDVVVRGVRYRSCNASSGKHPAIGDPMAECGEGTWGCVGALRNRAPQVIEAVGQATPPKAGGEAGTPRGPGQAPPESQARCMDR